MIKLTDNYTIEKDSYNVNLNSKFITVIKDEKTGEEKEVKSEKSFYFGTLPQALEKFMTLYIAENAEGDIDDVVNKSKEVVSIIRNCVAEIKRDMKSWY